jgi:hypothetical protein
MLRTQVSGAQIVPILYFWQPPAPSHFPFVEQAAAVMSWHTPRGSTLPAAVEVHLPGVDASEQLRQAPVQTVSQQTPSTQWVERHSVPIEHGWPFCFGPHSPLTQAWPVSQSASDRQTLLQAPSTHLKGLQFCTPCARQVPSPSQVPGVMRRVPEHDGGMHWVSAAYFSQPPNPSQVPVVPHEGAPMSLQTARGSGTPWSIGQQVPRRPGSAHDTQPPEQATLQHTPSAQKPEAQSALALQLAPFIFLPQLAFTHCCPPAHWLVWVQVSKQAPVVGSHENGAQMIVGPGLQRPRPSHERAPTTASPSHMPFPHSVPAAYLRQAPAPSQVPSKPQVAVSAAGQVDWSRGFEPAGMKVQVPMEPAALHVLHDSVQAALQHRPSTQKLLVQSELHVQAWPLVFFVSESAPHFASGGVSLDASIPPEEPAVPPPNGASDASRGLGAGWLPPQPATRVSAKARATPAAAAASLFRKVRNFMLR